jgi:hypothetical protein
MSKVVQLMANSQDNIERVPDNKKGEDSTKTAVNIQR